MIDEHRDPELDSIAAEWQAPQPSPDFHARMLSAFVREFVHIPFFSPRGWRRRLLLAGVCVAAGALMAAVLLRSNKPLHYEPVQQPHFMIVSAGEHP